MNSSAKSITWFSGIAGAVIVALLLFLCDPAHVHIYPLCPFHRVTGLDCPGCGSLRAAHQLLHGHLTAALHFNAMFVASLPLFAWIGIRFLRSGAGAGTSMPVVRPIWLWLYLAAWIAFGVVRNLPGVFAAFAAHGG